MTGVKATDEWSFRGLKAVVLENERLRVSLLPELGGKIYDIVHLPTRTNILWHNPRVRPRKVPFGCKFDDVWSGGWDEVFPNDAESLYMGDRFPDMGEIWSLPWDYELEEDGKSATVTAKVTPPISPVEIIRRLTLKEDDPKITCAYEIRNLGDDELKFLWKIHPAFAINERCSIEIAAEYGIVDERFAGPFAKGVYRWPRAELRGGGKKDVSLVSPGDHNTTLHYATGLRDGVVRFRDEKNGIVSEITFPKEVMDNVWLFLAYGGWRGVYNAVIEPSTSYPYDLATAVREGHCSRLEGGAKLNAEIGFEVRGISKE
ncbi:MAG: DUF5107 domain-containing protein [Nitrososphaerota archaeon]|nr:DUF5107 domain-containing protein [Nitrososphaerota archaeon]